MATKIIPNDEKQAHHGKLSVEDGWKWITKFAKPQPSKSSHLYCRLECEECSTMGRFGVMVVGKEYVQCYIGMMAWWARLCIPHEFPRNSLGIPFFGFSDLGNGVPF